MQRRRQPEKTDLPVRQLARLEHTVRKIGKAQAERCSLLRLRHHQPCATEGIRNDPVEIDGILPRMPQRRKHRRQIGPVLVQHRARHGQARLAQRRGAVGAEAMEEPPVRHHPPKRGDLGKVPGIAKQRHRRFRGQRLVGILLHAARGIAHLDCRPGPLHHRHRSAVIDHQLLGLHLRLQRESRRGLLRPQPDLDAVAEADGPLLVHEFDLELHPRRPVALLARARPQHREHAALGRKLMHQPPGDGRLHQLQRPIEIGFADAILAEKQRRARQVHMDRAERPVILSEHRAEQHVSLYRIRSAK
jgi:hypothetical protein